MTNKISEIQTYIQATSLDDINKSLNFPEQAFV